MQPLISVILPVKNGALFIDEALRSVDQATTNDHYEIIVVNDGSNDTTETVLVPWLKQKNIHYFTQTCQGPAVARNKALSVATGEYIAFIDADDVWTSNHIQVLLKQLEQHPESDIALGYTQRYLTPLSTHSPLCSGELFGKPILLASFGCGLFRRKVFEVVGSLDPGLTFHEDIEWYMRAKEKNIIFTITQQVVKYYRLHNANITRDLHPTDPQLLRVLAKSLSRRKYKTLPSLTNQPLS